MKTPSRTVIFTVLVLIAIVSVVVFQACATQSGSTTQDDKNFNFNLTIGKSAGKSEEFVEFKKNAKPQFDEALRKVHGSYQIHYKKDDLPATTVDKDYHPPRVGLKTDKVTTSDLAKNEPIGDPNVTRRVQSNNAEEIQNVLSTLKSSP
jgi:hypothetical protein